MRRLKPQRCPECGHNYIRFDLHWINCPKTDPKLDISNPPAQKLDKSATSNINNELDDLIMRFKDCIQHEDKDKPGWIDDRCITKAQFKQALTAHLQQEKSALLNELLEQKELLLRGLPTGDAQHIIEAIPVSVLLAKKKDLNQGGEV